MPEHIKSIYNVISAGQELLMSQQLYQLGLKHLEKFSELNDQHIFKVAAPRVAFKEDPQLASLLNSFTVVLESYQSVSLANQAKQQLGNFLMLDDYVSSLAIKNQQNECIFCGAEIISGGLLALVSKKDFTTGSIIFAERNTSLKLKHSIEEWFGYTQYEGLISAGQIYRRSRAVEYEKTTQTADYFIKASCGTNLLNLKQQLTIASPEDLIFYFSSVDATTKKLGFVKNNYYCADLCQESVESENYNSLIEQKLTDYQKLSFAELNKLAAKASVASTSCQVITDLLELELGHLSPSHKLTELANAELFKLRMIKLVTSALTDFNLILPDAFQIYSVADAENIVTWLGRRAAEINLKVFFSDCRIATRLHCADLKLFELQKKVEKNNTRQVAIAKSDINKSYELDLIGFPEALNKKVRLQLGRLHICKKSSVNEHYDLLGVVQSYCIGQQENKALPWSKIELINCASCNSLDKFTLAEAFNLNHDIATLLAHTEKANRIGLTYVDFKKQLLGGNSKQTKIKFLEFEFAGKTVEQLQDLQIKELAMILGQYPILNDKLSYLMAFEFGEYTLGQPSLYLNHSQRMLLKLGQLLAKYVFELKTKRKQSFLVMLADLIAFSDLSYQANLSYYINSLVARGATVILEREYFDSAQNSAIVIQI